MEQGQPIERRVQGKDLVQSNASGLDALATVIHGKSAVFAGVARNCAVYLPECLENFRRISTLYGRAAFIFVVSDSTDSTMHILESWMTENSFEGKVINLGDLEGTLPLRTQRIAAARNRYLMSVVQDGYSEYDHLVVADMDDVLGRTVSSEAFGGAVAWLDDVSERAGVFANAIPRYYDVWALRHPIWCPYDCWHVILGRVPGTSFESAKRREASLRQIEIPPDLTPIRVFSAFGGLGIYKMKFALQSKYEGLDWQGREEAEHVSYNRKIIQGGGQLFIFPALRVQAPEEHLRGSSSAIGMLVDRIQYAFTIHRRAAWIASLGQDELVKW